ncbi:ATP-binding protein [Streptomyces sp. T-3]|nr:ATP-binding protein [Streptomyces sp. T-3]
MSPHADGPTATAPHHLCFRRALRPDVQPTEGPGRFAVFAFLPEPRRIREVRHAVTALLTYWDVDADVRDTAELAVSELTTNAVVHSPASTSITVLLELTTTLHVEVRDGSKKLPMQQTSQDDRSESGRGLDLVAALCSEWGTTVYDNGSKAVWAHFPLPPRKDRLIHPQ